MAKEQSGGDRPREVHVFEQQLMHRIRSRVSRSIHCLVVEVIDNDVVLHGLAPSYFVKQLAQEAAKQMNEGSRVVNRIVVNRPNGASLPRLPTLIATKPR